MKSRRFIAYPAFCKSANYSKADRAKPLAAKHQLQSLFCGSHYPSGQEGPQRLNRVILAADQCLPIYPDKRTFLQPVLDFALGRQATFAK
jgi:hypothetical protein